MPPTGTELQVSRKLRTHRKSRWGCSNCKLRSVKCDETRPKCKKCTDYGVFCTYDGRHSDLQLSIDGAMNLKIPEYDRLESPRIKPGFGFSSSTYALVASGSSYSLKDEDLELLYKFQVRTAATLSISTTLQIYQTEFLRLAFLHPFLMHAVLSVTLMHDRYLSALKTKLSPVEAFHWYQATTLFKSKLSASSPSSELDAFWATSVLLGPITFYYHEGQTLEEAWPLKPPSSLDLNWLKMNSGKKEIWKVTRPLRLDCVFRPIALAYSSFIPSIATDPSIEDLPPNFIKLYNLDPASAASPYYTAAISFTQIFKSACAYSTILNFMGFISNITPAYTRLLEQKDAPALLLLAFWYAKVAQFRHWWIWPRAMLECQAICI